MPRALLLDQDIAGEVLGAAFARDQGEFFDLILERGIDEMRFGGVTECGGFAGPLPRRMLLVDVSVGDHLTGLFRRRGYATLPGLGSRPNGSGRGQAAER